MQIIDLSSTLYASLAVALRGGKEEPEEGLMRHMALNSIRANRVKFSKEFGDDFVIACDSRTGYWRRDIFPYYKHRRKAARDASSMNWTMIFEIMAKITEELKEHFPYRVVQVPGAEADDIIAVLAMKYHSAGVVILSRDHDYTQLHKFDGVKQWDPIGKKWVREKDPHRYLQEHIIRGDGGDGIPSILESDDFFTRKDRARPITAKKLDAWISKTEPMTDEQYRNWVRNDTLINFDKIPNDIVEAIHKAYEEQDGKDRSRIFDYMVKNRLRNLMSSIGDF